MAISINWLTQVISVPKADLTLIQPSPEIRELDLNDFRLWLKDIEDSEEGMSFVDTHQHNTTVTIGGLTLGRVFEIINGYTVTFEDGQYAINAVGANSNIADVMNVNQVSLRTFNSAGLQVISGSGTTAAEIWAYETRDLTDEDQYKADVSTLATTVALAAAQADITTIKNIEMGRWEIADNQMIFYEPDNVTEIMRFDLFDAEGNPAETNVLERVRV